MIGGDRMGSVVYLDYNATAPLRPEAWEAMEPFLRGPGNASSPHAVGQAAADAVERGRGQLAGLLGCSAGELFFTSGATEANNLAVKTALPASGRLVTSAVEHPAVLEAGRAEAGDGVVTVPVDREGRLDFGVLQDALACGPALVSVLAANNETGVVADLDRVVGIAHAAGAVVHTDATQLVGRLPVDLSRLNVDLLSLSAHKFGGPQGIGALFIRRGLNVACRPLLHGGEQERGWRAGTVNVAGVVGAGAAAAAAQSDMAAEGRRVQSLRDGLEEALLRRIDGAWVNGRGERRLPNTTSLTVPGAPADAALAGMSDIAASDGSACASGVPAPSHVLLAMGVSREDAESTLRFSLGHATTTEEVQRAIEATPAAVAQVRAALGVDTNEGDPASRGHAVGESAAAAPSVTGGAV